MKTLHLLIGLCAVVIGFGATLNYLLKTPVGITPLISTGATREQSSVLNDGVFPRNSDFKTIEFAATLNRPLFNRDRRKFVKPPPPKVQKPPAIKPSSAKPPPPVKPAEPQQPDPVYTLLGISIAKGKSSALLSQNGSNNIWVSSGDLIDTWKIADISENHVLLKLGNREISLYLYDDGGQ